MGQVSLSLTVELVELDILELLELSILDEK